MVSFAQNILHFLFNLQLPFKLPEKVEILDAHRRDNVKEACKSFYNKYYNDSKKRHLLLGINPGRFGGGATGIPFTDPIRLEQICGIRNDFQKKQELSSVFIYEMIDAFGGAEKFYSRFYISAVSPLGFVKDSKNMNYYDDKDVLTRIQPFLVDCMNKQLAFGIARDVCFCIGERENYKYLKTLNEAHKWFEHIETLSHPRFIMQYRTKKKQEYIQQYLQTLSSF